MSCIISATVLAFHCLSMRVPLASRWAWVSLANTWGFLAFFDFLALGSALGLGVNVGAATNRSQDSLAEQSR
jgi:hypothetical protein